MDELDLSDVIYTTGTRDRFEWWTEAVHAVMAELPAGTDPKAPPVRHVLRVPDDTREPVFESERITASR